MQGHGKRRLLAKMRGTELSCYDMDADATLQLADEVVLDAPLANPIFMSDASAPTRVWIRGVQGQCTADTTMLKSECCQAARTPLVVSVELDACTHLFSGRWRGMRPSFLQRCACQFALLMYAGMFQATYARTTCKMSFHCTPFARNAP